MRLRQSIQRALQLFDKGQKDSRPRALSTHQDVLWKIAPPEDAPQYRKCPGPQKKTVGV